MNITLYTTGSEKNKVTKTLQNALSFECTTLESVDILEPVVIIETGTLLSAYNYAHIPLWGRYYFINRAEIERNGVWTLSLKVDVLMSWNSGIRALTLPVARNAALSVVAVPDTQKVLSAAENIIEYPFTDLQNIEGFNPVFILETTGPGGVHIPST